MTRWGYLPKKKVSKKTSNDSFPHAGEGEFMEGMAKKESKYHSHKVEVDGHTFDSKKEAKRYEELKFLEEAGEIEGLELQKKFVLLPAQREPDTIGPRGGIKKGKVVEREVAYYADFYYHDKKTDKDVIEDVKSPITKTPVYLVKRKMLRYFYGLGITEI